MRHIAPQISTMHVSWGMMGFLFFQFHSKQVKIFTFGNDFFNFSMGLFLLFGMF